MRVEAEPECLVRDCELVLDCQLPTSAVEGLCQSEGTVSGALHANILDCQQTTTVENKSRVECLGSVPRATASMTAVERMESGGGLGRAAGLWASNLMKVVEANDMDVCKVKVDMKEEQSAVYNKQYQDGLFCSATGLWKGYELLSGTGLIAVEERTGPVSLIELRGDIVRRVPQGLLIAFDAGLEGARVDASMWKKLRPGEEVKRAKKRKVTVSATSEEEALEEDLRELPVKWAMLSVLGLLERDLERKEVSK